MAKKKENMELLEEIVKGTGKYHETQIEGLQRPIYLRPLSSAELLELQALEKRGMKATLNLEGMLDMTPKQRRASVKDQMQSFQQEFDFEKALKMRMEVRFKAISYSMDVDEDYVKKLPPEIVKKIFEKVVEVSGLTEDDLDAISEFR